MSDWSQHKVAKLCPSPDPPAWRALAAFPGPPGPPLASRSPMSRAERKKVPGVHARHLADRNVPRDRRNH
jgi:hypothetical protein